MIISTSAFSETIAIKPVQDTVQAKDADAVNKYVALTWRTFNRDVDSFFTNQDYRVKDNKSTVLLYSTFYKKEGQKLQNDYDFQLKVDLPRTTKKLKLVVEREQDEISNALSDENLTNSKNSKNNRKGRTANSGSDTESKYTAGLNYLLSQTKSFTSAIKFGIRLDMPVNPSIKIDLQKDYITEYVNISLSQKLLLYRQEGFQEISQLLFNRKWDEKVTTDFVNSLVWSHQSDELVLRNNLVYSQEVGEEKLLSYSIGANAKFKPAFWYYDSYDTSVSYRQLIYRTWLYGTFTLGADFPKVNNYKDEKFVQVRIEMFFR